MGKMLAAWCSIHATQMGHPFHQESYFKGKMYTKIPYKVIFISYTEKCLKQFCLS
jgi:hypothetical protein